MKKPFLVAIALCGLSLATQATELFVNIANDETTARGAGLVLAGQALAQKVPVRNKGRQAKDLIEGVTPANPADVMGYILKAGVKTLSF